MERSKFFLIFLGILLIVVSSNYFKKTPINTPNTHEVTLTENGFSPPEITINKGDTIKFKTSREKTFWPASNLHPTHSIYP